MGTLGRGMGSLEASDVKEKLGNDLKTSGDAVHPLIRGLRRGIGIYIEGLPSSYLRTLQSFAQQGRLGLVLSDELLAYGVNMPFRTCIFYGDPGADWLTPLIHQQMAGRAGRRGLDRQGHLIYAGFEPKRLQSLLRGQLPDVVGRFPLYPTIPLQLEMNKRYFGDSKPGCLTTQRMNEICSTPLAEFIQGRKIENYYNVAEQWIEELGVLKHPESSYKHLVIELIWDLRQFLPESFCIEFLLDYIIRTYKDQVFQEKDADLNQQVQIFLVFCSIVSRTPYDPNALKKYKSSLDSDALKSLEWIQPLPAPLAPHEEYTELLDLIKQSQDRIKNSNLPYKENILLPHGDSELDNLAFSSFVRNKIDPSLPTPLQHECRKRIWAIGEVMRICSNTLGRAAELMTVQNLIRKCFIRIRYILDETSQRNWKKMDNQGFQANDDEENIDPPSAP